MRILTALAVFAIAILSAGCRESTTRPLLTEKPRSASFCSRLTDAVAIVSEIFEKQRFADRHVRELLRLSTGFAEDSALFERYRQQRLAAASRTLADRTTDLAHALDRGDDQAASENLAAIPRAGLRVPRGFCHAVEDEFRWVVYGVLEVRAPVSWPAYKKPWRWSLLHPPSPGVAIIPDGSGGEWSLPSIYFAASSELATEIRVKRVRLALALQRLREWMERERSSVDACERQRTGLYAKPVSSIWGFVRRGDDCGGVGATVIEIIGVALPRERTTYVTLIRFVAPRPGDVEYVLGVESSHHLFH